MHYAVKSFHPGRSNNCRIVSRCRNLITVSCSLPFCMHFPCHCLKSSKPDIDLFTSGGIKNPWCFCLRPVNKLREHSRVTELVAKCVGLLMMSMCVEYIYNKSRFVEMVIALLTDVAQHLTCFVVEHKRRGLLRIWESILEKCLFIVSNLCIRPEILNPHLQKRLPPS